MTDGGGETNEGGVACLPVAGEENPYQLLMMRGLREGLGANVYHGADGKVLPFTRTVLRSRPALIHVDWAHQYLYRRRRALTMIQQALFVLDVALAMLLGARFAWTIHNVIPHGRDRVGRLRRWFAARCRLLRVFDAESGDTVVRTFGVTESKVAVVPEGSYVDYYPEALPALPSPRKVLLNVGNIRPYKNTSGLIEAFKRVSPGNWTLLIRGRAFDPAYAARCKEAAAGRPDIIIDDAFVEERDLPRVFQRATLVCLPFDQISNSGSVIMAMGYAKAVVAPASGAVAQRLSRQPELLFGAERPLENALSYALQLDADALAVIGERNRAALLQHSWTDFADVLADAAELNVDSRS